MKIVNNIFTFLFLIGLILNSCGSKDTLSVPLPDGFEKQEENVDMTEVMLPDIDLSNWKVTLPIGDPTEVEPPEILDYPNVEVLKKYMYHDQEDQSIVFYTEPGTTTTNSSYSRTELREQMVAGSNNVNWTYELGGAMTGKLKVVKASGELGKLDRIIVMQIHGRLTNEQRDLINKSDNNAPPVLKIYWDDGKINVRRKVLKDTDTSDLDILKKESWEDDSHWFAKVVGNDEFELSIKVKGTEMKISLGDEEELVFDDIHTQKWGVFENYFKAGNYLQTAASGSFSEVRYYALEVRH